MGEPADLAVRQEIFAALAERTAHNGGRITRRELEALPVGGVSRRLVDQSRGIWNPRDLDATLSIVSDPNGPYADEEITGGLLRYDYRRGSDDGDNRKLRAAYRTGAPIILLRKIETGVYAPIFPVYVVGDDRVRRQFLVAVAEAVRFLPRPEEMDDAQCRYAERVVRDRLHQPVFRAKVILAYDTRCAICALRHGELLDAAHIVPDGAPGGDPVVSNGLSLCKIHHAAYDEDLIGITPGCEVRVNAGLLAETDGPMLRHGLQDMHGRPLLLPQRRGDRPDPQRLEQRFAEFLAAG